MVEAIANACAVPAFTKKSAAKPVRAIAGAIAASALAVATEAQAGGAIHILDHALFCAGGSDVSKRYYHASVMPSRAANGRSRSLTHGVGDHRAPDTFVKLQVHGPRC